MAVSNANPPSSILEKQFQHAVEARARMQQIPAKIGKVVCRARECHDARRGPCDAVAFTGTAMTPGFEINRAGVRSERHGRVRRMFGCLCSVCEHGGEVSGKERRLHFGVGTE